MQASLRALPQRTYLHAPHLTSSLVAACSFLLLPLHTNAPVASGHPRHDLDADSSPTMNLSTEPGGARLLQSKTPSTSTWGGLGPEKRPLTPNNTSFPQYEEMNGALERDAPESDDDNDGPLTRQGQGQRAEANNIAAAGQNKRRRNTGKAKEIVAAAASSPALDDEEDEYVPAKSSRGAGASKDKDFPALGQHASRHQAAEQRRRNRIKEKLDELKTRVPHVDPRTNTACFLEAVLRYIDVLTARVHELEAATSAPRSSSSLLPQHSMSSPTQSGHQWDNSDRHHPQHQQQQQQQQRNGRGSLDNGTPAPAATMSECAYLLPIQSPGLLPSSGLPAPVNLLPPHQLTSPNVSLLGSTSAQPLLLQGHSMQVQLLQQQQVQLLLQHRLGEIQREQMEQQAASAMLGLHSPNQQPGGVALDAGSLYTNIWPGSGSVFLMPADLHLQGYGPGSHVQRGGKGQKALGGGFNTMEALEMLANQAGSAAGCYLGAAQLGGGGGGGGRAACFSVSEEDMAPMKRGRK